MNYSWVEVKKFLVALVGFIMVVLTSVITTAPNSIPVTWLPWIQGIIAVFASYGVYKVKNIDLNNEDKDSLRDVDHLTSL